MNRIIFSFIAVLFIVASYFFALQAHLAPGNSFLEAWHGIMSVACAASALFCVLHKVVEV